MATENLGRDGDRELRQVDVHRGSRGCEGVWEPERRTWLKGALSPQPCYGDSSFRS